MLSWKIEDGQNYDKTQISLQTMGAPLLNCKHIHLPDVDEEIHISNYMQCDMAVEVLNIQNGRFGFSFPYLVSFFSFFFGDDGSGQKVGGEFG